MAYTDNMRRQHREILVIAKQIGERLTPDQIRNDAKGARTLLSNLAGKLTFHLAGEDQALYPRLMKSEDPATRKLAQQFITEMGGLGQAFTAYNEKWQIAAIAADPEGFCTETRGVFAALGKRIEREDTQLYPLADHAPA